MPVVTHEISAALRIQKARTTLLLDHPFFGSLLFRLKGRESRSIATMATDGVSLYYNPKFVDMLNSATLAGVLAHEVMHPGHFCSPLCAQYWENRDFSENITVRITWGVSSLFSIMAEREGFEPPIALRLCLISSQVHSTGLCHLSAC